MKQQTGMKKMDRKKIGSDKLSQMSYIHRRPLIHNEGHTLLRKL